MTSAARKMTGTSTSARDCQLNIQVLGGTDAVGNFLCRQTAARKNQSHDAPMLPQQTQNCQDRTSSR